MQNELQKTLADEAQKTQALLLECQELPQLQQQEAEMKKQKAKEEIRKKELDVLVRL